MADEQAVLDDGGMAAVRANAAVWERRWTVVYVVVFLLVVGLFATVWLRLSAGERACKGWMADGEPRLVAIMIKMESGYDGKAAICTDAEALQYFEACYRRPGPLVLESDLAWLLYLNRCRVEFRFENGAVYRLRETSSLTTDGLSICLPGESGRNVGFEEPMPEAWKNLVVGLLGHGAFEEK
jgi:hypothetical protein